MGTLADDRDGDTGGAQDFGSIVERARRGVAQPAGSGQGELSQSDAVRLLAALGLNENAASGLGSATSLARANVVGDRIEVVPENRDVPSANLPNNVGAKGVSPSDFSFHTYDVQTPGGHLNPPVIGRGITNNPVPGGGVAASPLGTVNDAGPIPTLGEHNFVRSYSVPSPDASRYTDITVNYTQAGRHGLGEGFVIRYGDIHPDGSVTLRSYGEGNNWHQAPILKSIWGPLVEGAWQDSQKDIVRKAGRQ